VDFLNFKKNVLSRFNLNLNAYKENQLKRRLDSLMSRKKLEAEDYQGFFNLLTNDRKAYNDFLDTLTINVSEFFRDKNMFDHLEKNSLPSLLASRNTLKVWSAACSIGAEPYSIAIILDEKSPGRRHVIEATDIDRNILHAASLGKYNPDQIRNVNPSRLSRYFKNDGRFYHLDDRIKKMVTFRQHDLLLETFGQGYDLIICRNVTIYFTREAQDRLNAKFYKSLNPGGLLFIGASEMLFNYHEIGFEKIASCFYRKKSG
jgi:chemotaxis protein methyltransferase CheR